jgi:hypothetical protein
MITALADVATNETRALARSRGRIFMETPYPWAIEWPTNDFN